MPKHKRSTLERSEEPDIAPGDQCDHPFACDFANYCSPPKTDVAFPLEILPYGKKMAEQLRARGYRDLRDVPEEKLSNPKHIRVHQVTEVRAAELDQEAIDAVRPADFIDPMHSDVFRVKLFFWHIAPSAVASAQFSAILA